jgi:hypothetical protein
MKGSANTCSFSIIFLIPILAFSLTSAGILNGNTVIGIDAYAKKSNESSGESSRRGSTSGSSDKGTSSNRGSDSKGSSYNNDNKNSDQVTNNNEQQQQEIGSNDGSNTVNDNNLQSVVHPAKCKITHTWYCMFRSNYFTS